MKILSIRKDGREIASSSVQTPMMIIGRSPSCDIVLRAKGLKPVHFLLEWVGVGSFEEGDGVWSIFDVAGSASGAESESSQSVVGEGIVVGSAPATLGGFEFCWKQDRLQATPLEGGSLLQSFNEQKMQAGQRARAYQLELVTIREDSGSVSHVFHRDPPKNRERMLVFPNLPEVTVQWGGQRKADETAPLKIDLARLNDARVYDKGVELLNASGEPPKVAMLTPGDLIQIQWQMNSHYFRLMPKINVPPVPFSILSDPFYRAALAGVLFSIALVLFIRHGDFQPKVAIAAPPRIATVEVKEPPQPVAVAPPAPEPTPPPPPPQELPKQLDSTVASNNVASKFAPEPEVVKPTAGLNSPAPKAKVNSIGLLGAMKAKKVSTVTADRVLNDGIVSKTVSGSEGQVVLKQPPSGVLGKQNEKAAGLTGAFTTLKVKDSAEGQTSGAVAGPGEVHDGSEYSKSDVAMQEFETQGGLDKESIKRTLAAYRKDVRTCYERALLMKPQIKGRVVYKWQIAAEGQVTSISTVSSTLDSANLVTCVEQLLKTVIFPKASNHQPTIVIYPFEFQSKS